MGRLTFKRILFSALFLCAVFAASAKDIFSGRSYRATKFLMSGMDLMPLMNVGGNKYIEITFNDDGTFRMMSTTDMDALNGEGTYKVNRRKQSLIISFEGEDIHATYTDGGDVFTMTGGEEDGEAYSMEFTAVELIPEREVAGIDMASLDDTTGNAKVRARTFVGRSYAASQIFVEGNDYTSVMAMMGVDVSSLLKFTFIDAKTVRVVSEASAMMGSDADDGLDSEVGYRVDTASQTISCSSPDEDGELILYYYAGGSRLKLIQPNDEGAETVVYFEETK